MSRHTPGPWFVLKDSYAIGTKPDARTGYPPQDWHGAICVLDDDEYISNPNRVADANLIAAAPEMYQALGDLRHAMTVFADDISLQAKGLPAQIAIGDAIEKCKTVLEKLEQSL